MKILLDTDPGSDIDDLLTLAYLLSRPECEILGITIATGQPRRRADLFRSLLNDRGVDVPINAGYVAPLARVENQPEVPHGDAASGSFDHDETDPADFLARHLDAHEVGEVVIFGIAGLTNVARLQARHPKSFARAKEVLLMNGQFREDWTEWNVQCDPDATARIYRQTAVPVRTVGYCQTGRHAVEKEEGLSFVPEWAPTLRRGVTTWFDRQSPKMFFHDVISAVELFDEGFCVFETGRVEMVDDLTRFHPDPTGNVRVATDWRIEPFKAHLRHVLRGD